MILTTVPPPPARRTRPGVSVVNPPAAPAPTAGRDLRGGAVTELCYPAGSVVVVAGVPGAGKTTLLRRLFGTTGAESTPVRTACGVQVLDSEQSRTWWRRYLGRLPYPWWRLLVHVTHYGRLLRALRGGRCPIVVHDCATRAWSRWLIMTAARGSTPVHLLLLDVSPPVAAAGQVARARRVRVSSFAAHCRSWRRLVRAVDDRAHPVHRRAASVTVIDRAAADRLETIRFGAA